MARTGRTWSADPLRAALRDTRRGHPGAGAILYIRHADTGAKPLLFAADDGKQYWCKWPQNPHGNRSLANEWIVLRLGMEIGAPVRPGQLVHVEEDLLHGLSMNGDSPHGGVYFGSELLSTVEETTSMDFVGRDGNSDRFPRFLGLWELCLGQDPQFVYDHSNDLEMWSIDHGLWFNSLEQDWSAGDLPGWEEAQWDWPNSRRLQGLNPAAFLSVADAIDELHPGNIGRAVGSVPVDWGISDEDLHALAHFIHRRCPVVASHLRESAAQL